MLSGKVRIYINRATWFLLGVQLGLAIAHGKLAWLGI